MFHAQNPQTRTCRAATATEQAASACTKRTAAKKPTAGTRGSASAASSTTSKEASRRSTSCGITYGQRITKCVLLNFCLLDYLKKVWSKRLTHLTIPLTLKRAPVFWGTPVYRFFPHKLESNEAAQRNKPEVYFWIRLTLGCSQKDHPKSLVLQCSQKDHQQLLRKKWIKKVFKK